MSQKSRRNDVTAEIVVGAFMFVILVILLTVTLVISQNRFFERAYFLQVNFPNIGGLKTGEPVFMRGVRVGNVNEINVPTRGRGVDVTLRLTREVELHEDYRFIIEPASMLGGMRLVIEEGSENLPVLTGTDLENLRGLPVANLLDDATQALNAVRDALENGILDDIRAFTANLREISDKVNQGEGTIARLINDDSLHRDLEGVLANVRSTTAVIAAGEGTLGRLIHDATIANELEASLANVRAFTEDAKNISNRLEKGEGTLGRLLSNDDAVYEDLRATVAALREFTAALNNQQGTLGLLINEDGIYRQVEALLNEARATLDDFRETSPITTFSSIFFGAF